MSKKTLVQGHQAKKKANVSCNYEKSFTIPLWPKMTNESFVSSFDIIVWHDF